MYSNIYFIRFIVHAAEKYERKKCMSLNTMQYIYFFLNRSKLHVKDFICDDCPSDLEKIDNNTLTKL